MVEQVIAIQVPVGTLHEGKNTLQLTLPGDTGVQWDMINLDKFSLNYQRLYRAQAGRLTFTSGWPGFRCHQFTETRMWWYTAWMKKEIWSG